jgi:hypothetical protein
VKLKVCDEVDEGPEAGKCPVVLASNTPAAVPAIAKTTAAVANHVRRGCSDRTVFLADVG